MQQMELREKALLIALTQIGVQEEPHGSNSGHMVDRYLRSVGLAPGYSWCMALMYWCMAEAAKQQGVANPMIKTGGVLRQYNSAKSNYRTSVAERGNIFILDYGQGMGHTGIIEWAEGKWMHTVEGNTNDEGEREGYEVCRRQRPIIKAKGFLKYV